MSKQPKRFSGRVVSAKMAKTVVVLVKRYVKHPKYGKYESVWKKYKAHVEGILPAEGVEVMIEECRPISKDKHFKIIQTLQTL